MRKLPVQLKIFLVFIVIITIASLGFFITDFYSENTSVNFTAGLFFVVLITFTESCAVIFRDISFSTSFAIQLAIYILFGPINTVLIIAVGFTFRILKVKGGYKHVFNTPIYGTIFNYCVLVLPIIYATYLYRLIGETFCISNLNNKIPELVVFCLIVLLINTFIISILYSIMSKKNIVYSFISNIRLGVLNIAVMAPFGILLAYVFKLYKYSGVILVLFPIVLARYTFSLYIQSKSQYVETVDALMLAMEARDRYTEGHSKRVAEISASIAKELRYTEWKIEQLNMAALLHDVGKIGVDDHILNKPGKLTDEEFDTIRMHPLIGYNILKDIKNLANILPIIRHHHERYDGKGYPDGKKAEELSLDVFIIQLADSIDAMATDRPYRKALNNDVIIEEIKKHCGSQFHPKVVEAYFRVLEKQKR